MKATAKKAKNQNQRSKKSRDQKRRSKVNLRNS
jgi:ribosomal protein L28